MFIYIFTGKHDKENNFAFAFSLSFLWIETLHPCRLASALLSFVVNECPWLIANQERGLMDPKERSANSNSVALLIDT